MRVVVSGVNGFVGTYLAANLLANGDECLGIDLQESSKVVSNDSEQYHYLSGDLSNFNPSTFIEGEKKYDVFFHLAWRGSGGEYRSEPKIQLENVLNAVKSVEIAKGFGCKRFVFISSIVELEANNLAYIDGYAPDKHYIYGGAKSACHTILKPYCNSLGIELIWVNLTGIYGVGDTTPNFVNSTLKKMLSNNALDFTMGDQFFDFVYITDAVNGIRLLGEKGRANFSYVIGSGKPLPVKEYVKKIASIAKCDRIINFGALKYTGLDNGKALFDISKASNDVGYFPVVSFEDGVNLVYSSIREKEGF